MQKELSCSIIFDESELSWALLVDLIVSLHFYRFVTSRCYFGPGSAASREICRLIVRIGSEGASVDRTFIRII